MWGRVRPSDKFLLLSVPLLGGFTPLFVLVMRARPKGRQKEQLPWTLQQVRGVQKGRNPEVV